MEYIDIYNEKVKELADKVAFSDCSKELTYKELDEESAKIYSYLKSKGIGKEKFVQVVLERSVRIPEAIMGVVKAGAAFVVLEDTYPEDRIEYIYKDCSCLLRIDDTLYEKIMAEESPLYGNETTDSHDACYAVYTSGSTGNPKGVLHEYGNIMQNCNSFDTWYDDDVDRSAIFAPFYFVAGILDIFHYITRGRTTYIVPHGMTRDFVAVKKFIEENSIEEIFLPPSYLKIYPKPAKTIKVLYTGSEPANGLTYYDNPTLINFYAMSESGFVVLQSNLNKPYAVAPVGKPLLEEINVCLLDEDGEIIEGVGQGELCFVNEYVRGYINLPEQTAKTWRNGLFHTNDCVRRDEDGNYYVIGRFDDMIKVNGNRVEPVEIENHIKELTGLKQVIAKGFQINNRVFICAYYIVDEAQSLGIYEKGELSFDKEKLEKSLPDYMIPTYYIGLEKFPLLPNGKTARKDFLPPNIDESKSEYIAPTNECEKTICDVFSHALKLDKVSITDDFYIIGGDSMSAIVAVAKLSEKGIRIDTKALYDNRTAEKIALFYEENKDKLSHKIKKFDNSRALEVPNFSGKAFIEQTKQGMGGIFRYCMKDKVNVKALTEAYNKVLAMYPFYNLTFEEREDNVYYKELKYVPEVRPFNELDTSDHTNKPLIEVYYEDKEIIINFFHVLTDGEGFFFFASTLLHEYVNAYQGIEEEPIIRDFDYTYDVLEKEIPVQGSQKVYDLLDTYIPPEYDASKATLKTYKIRLDRKDWKTYVDKFISDYGVEGIRRLLAIGGEDAFVAGYALIKAFSKVHPEADKPLMCRFPMNMRSALGRENTLRNCALPQAFYNITTRDAVENAEAVVSAYERISEMTSSDNVKKEVNKLVEYLHDDDKNIDDDDVYSYIKTASVLATNLGNIASVRDTEYLRDFSINFRPSCYTSIQSCVMGKEQVLIVNQVFESKEYVRELVSEISLDGMINISVEEVN